MKEERVIRLLKREDLEAVVAIDELAFKRNRRNYFERKVADSVDPQRSLNTSIVCEVGGKVIGFIMGGVYTGEFGVPETTATIDTLGVHPDWQNHGIASELLDQFLGNMKQAGVEKVHTLVNWDEFALEKFFSRHKFAPSKRLNLEYQLP
ncbi:MAG: GNAT family N-acetyltransferase [Rhodocyclaceae bacterium]|jgi:predicted N-acetyltransferase YhbS|nr:GNAT family N-acetyltransferase [Rhodocyclaceae bacterium]